MGIKRVRILFFKSCPVGLFLIYLKKISTSIKERLRGKLWRVLRDLTKF